MHTIICPKCTGKMEEWTSANVTLDHCGRCRGLWFDESELTRHFANLGSNLPESNLRTDQATSFDCPRCVDVKLLRASFDGIAVESCPRCRGTFLDLGEVHELLGAVNRQAGGAIRRKGLSGFDDFALGLYIGSHLDSSP